MFDEHYRMLTSHPPLGPYSALPVELRLNIEARLRRTSEFFVNVVLVFVIRDLGQLLDKFAKKGARWMEE
ncbi:hypothetical protein FRC03_004446 [Tulasnella sp. 419]|nr:hypothetical protein FRC03_004446 [Tulasnella sp. 419]